MVHINRRLRKQTPPTTPCRQTRLGRFLIGEKPLMAEGLPLEQVNQQVADLTIQVILQVQC